MKTIRWLSALAATLVACAASGPRAHADGAGLYFSAAAGGALPQDESLSGGGGTLVPSYQTGVAAAVAVGYELPLAPIRLEAEVSYRTNDIDKVTPTAVAGLTSGTTVSASGTTGVLAGMANAYIYLPVPIGLEPYVGVGLGYAQVDVDSLSAGGASLVNGSDWSFAYQGIVGVELDFIPGPLDLGIEYRYFAVEDANVSGTAGSFGVGYKSHAVMARLRLGL